MLTLKRRRKGALKPLKKAPLSAADRALVEGALAASNLLAYQWNIQKDKLQFYQPADLALLDCGEILKSRDFHQRIEPPDLAMRLDCLSDHIRFGTPFTCEYRLILPDGSRRWILESGQAEFAKDRTPKKLRGTLQDITSLKQQEKSYGKLAIFDDLTGAYSVFRLKEMLEHALAYTSRYDSSGAFAILDIYNLTKVNMKYGYEVGDAVMASITHRLRTQLRAADTLGRLEGDMLGILLSNCADADVLNALQRLASAVTEKPVVIGGKEIPVTLSIGGVRFPGTADTVPDVWQYAEIALDHAKQQYKKQNLNRSNVVLYRTTTQEQSSIDYTQRVEKILQNALSKDGFELAFQAIIDLEPQEATNQLPIYECLLRLKQPECDIQGPADFIPIAEKTELMWQIDVTVLKKVCQELRRCDNMVLAYNISARTAGNPRWMHAFRQEMKQAPNIAQRMIVEITETAAIGLTTTTIDFIEQLRGYGCKVALDDFGAGYTSFRQLKLLPLDYIKIDGDMVRNFNHNQHNKLFVRTILDLSLAFNLKVIAEGVETPEQRDELAAEGVQLMQGYLFERPSTKRAWQNEC